MYSQMLTFENHDVGSLFLHSWYMSREYMSSLYMKVIGSRSRSQEQKGRKVVQHGVFDYGGSNGVTAVFYGSDHA